MKRYYFIIAALSLLTLGCEEQLTISEQNRKEIVDYLNANNLDATEDVSGLFYLIEEEGSGGSPNPSSSVEVRYKGYFTNGTIFDQTTGDNTREIELANTIIGWRIGIPKMQKNGKAKFFIPSSLGYGYFGSGSVPPNAVLVFEVELVNFAN